MTAEGDAALARIGADHGILALYLFGSRADDGLALLGGAAIHRDGSDLDIGVVFADRGFDSRTMAALQVAIEDRFAPLRVDLVPLDRVDALFQFRAIDGHRVMASDPHQANEFELVCMRKAAELAPIEAALERETFRLERPT